MVDGQEVFKREPMNGYKPFTYLTKLTITFALILSFATQTSGQYGYVKLESDSLISGYIKSYKEFNTAEQGLEIWRTKQDKAPIRILKTDIREYAIKKDTSRILHDFSPFIDKEIYFHNAEAQYVNRGKLNLLVIKDYKRYIPQITPGNGASVISLGIYLVKYGIDKNHIYIIEDSKTGLIKAMPSKKEGLNLALLDFFPESFLQRYAKEKKEITDKNLPEFIAFYNSK